jgi:hypothetical protein
MAQVCFDPPPRGGCDLSPASAKRDRSVVSIHAPEGRQGAEIEANLFWLQRMMIGGCVSCVITVTSEKRNL